MLKRVISFMSCMVLAAAVAACGSSTGPPEGSATLSIAFREEAGTGSASTVSAGATLEEARASTVTLQGSNGTLVLEDVRFVVAEFELERADSDDGCALVGGDDCEEFEVGPQFLDLPLDGGAVPVVAQSIPAGLYEELEFEIEDLDLDDADEDAAAFQQLFQEILQVVPDWPEDASLLVAGTFTPTGGQAVPFRVFFDAEIEIEIEFPEPGLDVRDEADPSVTVVVDPAVWFSMTDGTVLDLSQFDGEIAEFEVEIENGFTEIEFDDD